jgi:RimJ/RimL family protein N-acetyltransferase
MKKEEIFLFTSERLGFRNWRPSDYDKMIGISSNPRVMEFFPALATPEQTRDFIQRMQNLFATKGFCYFAVDLLESREFIGFIGLNEISYATSFSPGIDIGWRLSPEFWGKGLATEGAERCIRFGFENLSLSRIVATAPQINEKSIRVMQKIGMQKLEDFKHPRLSGNSRLENCVCYEINLPRS